MKKNILMGALVIGLLGALGLLGKLWYTKHELGQINNQLNERLMQANLAIGKAHTQFGDANKYANELEEALQKEIDDRNELLTRYGKLKAQLKVASAPRPAEVEVIYREGEIIEVPVKDTFVRGLLYEAITDSTLMPIGEIRSVQGDHRLSILCLVEPEPNRDRRIPVRIGYQMQMYFSAQLVETRAPTGAVNYYVNLYEVDKEGNLLNRLPISDFQMTVNDLTKPEMQWWAPHLDIGAFAGVTLPLGFRPGASLGFSTSGYGKTDNDLIWRFARLSLDVSGETIGLGLTPAMYNMGQILPLVSNVWIGPHVGWSLDNKKHLGLFLGAVL